MFNIQNLLEISYYDIDKVFNYKEIISFLQIFTNPSYIEFFLTSPNSNLVKENNLIINKEKMYTQHTYDTSFYPIYTYEFKIV